MHLAVLLVASLVVTVRAGTVRQQKRLIADLNNDLHTSSIPTKQMRKFVGITKKPNAVIHHKIGTTLELICEGIGAPAPNIRWFKNDVPVYEHNLESNEIIEANPTSLARVTSTLLISRTVNQDEYTCVVSAGFKTAKASSIVYSTDGSTDLTARAKLVPLAPRILVSYRIYVDTIGNDVLLPCKVRGHPRPEVTWRDNKGNIIKSDHRMKVLRSGKLLISPLDWNDMGEFTCEAKNEFGYDTATTFIYPAKAA